MKKGLKIPQKINGASILMVPIYIIAGYVFIPWRLSDAVYSKTRKLQILGAFKDLFLYTATAMLIGLAWPLYIIGKIKK
jgi:hypothetical protein